LAGLAPACRRADHQIRTPHQGRPHQGRLNSSRLRSRNALPC
jgi:hypothetical protein